MRPPTNGDTNAIATHRNQAIAYYDANILQLGLDLGNELATLQQLSRDISEKEIIATEESIDGTTRNVIIAMGICALILVATSFAITKAVTAPLNQMIHICNKLRDGDFRDKGHTSETRGDEFGEMTTAVFDMRTTINQLMNCRTTCSIFSRTHCKCSPVRSSLRTSCTVGYKLRRRSCRTTTKCF